MQAAETLIREIVGRTNSVTGARYVDDPTIMAWQLANEPRGISNTSAFARWLERTSSLIKSLDARHLVTTGSEGETTDPASAGVDFVANHRLSSIDYATAHIWAQNWGWFDPDRAQETYPLAVAKMSAYLADHAAKAKTLGKPLVIEEFGIGRDAGSYSPAASTSVRDRYYGEVFQAVLGSTAAGVNFWAWSGEARPRDSAGGIWQPGDPFVGDPPHELQGWYGVYDSDAGTQAVIARFAREMALTPAAK
jgi:mannan endo-1,4-beta-mannosidase